jgi:hypothetical protein
MGDSNPTSMRGRTARAGGKHFTVEQAEQTLPLVGRVLTDLVTQFRLVERNRKRRQKLGRLGRLDELAVVEAQGMEAGRRVSDLIDELASIGCAVKDYERGCVDFPALRDGREVFLCWKLGEERILYWHETHEGMSRRHRLAR